ncbi:Crp/Fnr family transcriptional regulator [Lactobacillus sp. CBA3606]|uniref:Crp/Fnr family transcriptional regulator n=1 Tax=Lactobacillus sp. CBA3606 TaxID=2099789 RepID=UPI000CFBB7D1|nr:Crp/Fnr family transcriptional regulator [Lactobacillus sp. CBA3606]AVK63786.1 Crp/Fnr family transcriptional regulator [Lactobacillus sp. CBA3606]
MDAYFKTQIPVFNQHWAEIAPLFTAMTVPEKTTLLREGDIAHNIYFVDAGAVRLWHNDDGRDITVQFFFENQIVASFQSLTEQTPSQFSLETLAPTQLTKLSYPHFNQLVEKYPALQQTMTHQISARFMTYMTYFLSRIQNNPEQRVIDLMANEPEILARVPHHYIASYLGMTPVSFSRIQKRLR